MKRFVDRAGWAIAGALALAVLAVAAKAVQGGPLDPPGVPGSTMRTLADLVPAWDQKLTSNGCGSQRWTCVFSDSGVLDNETGLVWEKTPLWSGTDNWINAKTSCTSDSAGGRYGWRLPSVEELLTLKDPNTGGDIVDGAPFIGVSPNSFWSSTVAPEDDTAARYIIFNEFASNEQVAQKTLGTVAGIWCVRGGQAESQDVPTGLTSWSKKLSALSADACNSQRFTCVMDGTAVLDHETGLVWQRNVNFGVNTPSILPAAFDQCAVTPIDGRTGWRLPTAAEMGSMIDQTQTPSLPPGHPFQNTVIAPNGGYWTTTTAPGGSQYYIGVLTSFGGGGFDPGGMNTASPGSNEWTWCVRGDSAE